MKIDWTKHLKFKLKIKFLEKKSLKLRLSLDPMNFTINPYSLLYEKRILRKTKIIKARN